MVSVKKFSFGANGLFWPKYGMLSQPWIHSKDFFEIKYNERSQGVHENYINGFFEKNILSKWAILGSKMVRLHNSRSTLRILFFFFFEFSTIKGNKRFMKFKLMVFPKNIWLGQIDHFGPKILEHPTRSKSGNSFSTTF